MARGDYGSGFYGGGPYGIGSVVSQDLTVTYNVRRHATADIVPIYSLLTSGALTQARSDLVVIYKVISRVYGDLTVNYNVGQVATPVSLSLEIEEEFDPEELNTFAQRVWDLLLPIRLESTDLNHYIGGIGELFQEIEDYAIDTPQGPGWSPVVDVNRVPTKAIDWLAQFVGITINHDDSDDGMRQQLRSHDRWGRGTPAAILGEASKWIPEGSQLYMSERNTNPWHITFILVDSPGTGQLYRDLYDLYISYHKVRVAYDTYNDLLEAGRGDWERVQQELFKAKPAGIQYSFINTTSILYLAIYILIANYQALYDTYATYQALYAEPFPDINFGVPLFRQLVSTRYYRNIYNQYQSYVELWESFQMY